MVETFRRSAVREGFKKNPANYPHFVDKGGGHRMWISEGEGGSPHVHFLLLFWPFYYILSGI